MSKKRVRAGFSAGQILALDHTPFIFDVFVDSVPVNCLIDTGAGVSCVRPSVVSHHLIQRCQAKSLIGADGRAINIFGKVKFSFKFKNMDYSFDFYVVPNLSYPIILGIDFLSQYNAVIHCKSNNVSL